ncbi:hypothetical protein KAH94_02915 [bacterium]|nr:hypothetical protein [bacterium]
MFLRIKLNWYVLVLFFCFFSNNIKTDEYTIAHIFDQLCMEHDITQFASDEISIVMDEIIEVMEQKDLTIVFYISADNDLAPFSIRNIKQMACVGSNEYINIVVQLDIRKSNGEKITRRYYIKKDQVVHLNADDPDSQGMDSGDPETLISCCDWAITNFPAKQYGLVFWNHGSGILDPRRCRALTTEELFTFNQRTQRLDLDRSVGYIDRMIQRGICFDDSTSNYLTNQKLEYALDKICKEFLEGKKFGFIGFDACLMQMIEIASLMKNYAHIMVGSQEAGLGYGWNYVNVLQPFTDRSLEPEEFAEHIVKSYEDSYIRITSDYTMSAIDLGEIDKLEKNVNNVACLLMKGLRFQKNGMVKKAIKASRNRMICTHFDEPSYIDLHHFYGNLIINIDYIKLQYERDEKTFKENLLNLLEKGRAMIESIIFAYTSGKSLSLARGLSIYFPERSIHSSYKKTNFAKKNNWINFIKQYLIL